MAEAAAGLSFIAALTTLTMVVLRSFALADLINSAAFAGNSAGGTSDKVTRTSRIRQTSLAGEVETLRKTTAAPTAIVFLM